jgi:hypothetical protein
MNWISRTVMLGSVLVLSLTGDQALAGKRSRDPQLQLGRPRVVSEGVVALPVKLKAKRQDEIAALNFSIRYDVTRVMLEERGVSEGPAVRRATASLSSKEDIGGGVTRVLVVPEYAPEFATIQGQRVATVYLRLHGKAPKSLKRWVRRNVTLENVVLSNRDGRELRMRPQTKRKGR